MESIHLIAIAVSFLLAMNIGASNSAAEMAAAYGAGARTKKEAVTLIAIFALLGAIISGGAVINTLGNGLVSGRTFSETFSTVFIVLIVATTFVIFANYLKSPIATTHAIVCAVVGIGLYTGELNTKKFIQIVLWWILTPSLAFIFNYLIGKYLYFKILHYLTTLGSEEKIKRLLSITITISGCYVAFSAGSNNAANAVGAIVGAGVIPSSNAAIMAGLGMGLGAILFGGRILDTVGKGITDIGIVRAISIESTGATIIYIASLMGIPVSLNETITSGIIATSCARVGFKKTAKNEHVVRILFFWFGAPFFAVSLSYGLTALWMNLK
ncbi:MAG: inorganic phosphate transporter [Nitrospinae bacterium]|nr:inorganic phosphate transporter [Nitrospinota bacterium]